MKRSVGFIACLLGFACVIFAGVLAAVHIVGTDADLYHQLQMKAGILGYAGISEETLVKLDDALAEYLAGKTDSLTVSAEVFGRSQPAFNQKELIHMADCRRLFNLLRSVMAGTAALGVLFVPCGIYLLRDRRRIRLAAWLSPLATVVPLGALAVWAVVDFNAAFNFFHEMLFTNDLWLLNPATDLLIRLCPASMFMAMGARIGLLALGWALSVPAFASAAVAFAKERI